MGLVIDTGDGQSIGYKIDKLGIMRDAAANTAFYRGTDADSELAKLIIADLLKPKKAETARQHFLGFWPLLSDLAERAPASFDLVIEKFSERIAEDQ